MGQGLRVPWDSTWREVPGFPNYWISQYGQVFNMRSNIVVAPWRNGWYGNYVTLRRDNKSYSRKVENLYAIVFPEWVA